MERMKLEKVPWTGVHTLSTGGTFLFAYHRESIFIHIKSIEMADLYAVSVAQTAKRALFVPAN
jgi:hypothetical protein